MKPFLICTAIGALISAIGWFAPPERVVSAALLSAPGLESPARAEELDQRITTLWLKTRPFLTAPIHAFGLYEGRAIDEAVEEMRRDLTIERILLGPSQALRVRFRYRDPRKASAVVYMLTAHLSRDGFRILDPPSYPVDRTVLYRLIARECGLPVGLITGVILGWRRRATVPTEILAAT